MSEPPVVHWLSIFLDVPAPDLDREAAFWSTVTGSGTGQAVGDHGEHLPLAPPDGDPCVWLQRTDDDTLASHPDLYVEDVGAAAGHALGLGAEELSRRDGLVVLRSPGGLPFCLVRWRGQDARPGAVGAAAGIVDQLCLDIPPSRYDAEAAFWTAFTGWPRYGRVAGDEFERLRRPAQVPHAFLLQRLDDEQPTVSSHVDLAAGDRESETERHVAAGATVLGRFPDWTVLRDPVGRSYCITARRPGDV
ncbi:MAG: VOC family protein [Nocardioidaceae bacterium]|nr:VOC family protein [Nocardioidaceae bacterium]